MPAAAAMATAVPLPIATFSRGRHGPSLGSGCHLSRLLRPRGVRVRGRAPMFSLRTPRAARSEVEEGEASGRLEEEDEGPAFSVLTSIRSPYNEIVVVDTPTSRVLLLDSTHNVHSILNKGQILTNSYWDEFATLPAIIPKGPIAILGLGGGTAAHLILDLWPSLHLVAWEIDEIVDTWLELEKKLMPHGRIMINCGGAHAETSNSSGAVGPEFSKDDTWVQNSTIKALCVAFDGKLSWKRMAEKDSENYMALTGPIPEMGSWSASVPSQLVSNVTNWKPCVLA